MIKYIAEKEKGTSRYYVCTIYDKKIKLTECYKSKKDALRQAAKMENMDLKSYMKLWKKYIKGEA